DRFDDVTAAGVNDPLPNMVTTGGLNTPAPWVPYTRAGCDYGAVSTANVVLENTKTTPAGDMTKVFGTGSPEWNEASATPALAQTDFVGIAIHCAAGGGICNSSTHARPDTLPDEPGAPVRPPTVEPEPLRRSTARPGPRHESRTALGGSHNASNSATADGRVAKTTKHLAD